MLAGAGALLGVMTQRLGRAVDRARALEMLFDECDDPKVRLRVTTELGIIDRRMVYANRATILVASASFMICGVVALVFAGEVLHLPLGIPIIVLFSLTLLTLMAGLTQFLFEVSWATRLLRVRADFLAQRSDGPARRN